MLRSLPLLRLRLAQRGYHVCLLNGAAARRPLCTSAAESTGGEGDKSPSIAQMFQSTDVKGPPRYPKLDEPDFGRWKDEEAKIFADIEPIVCLTKEILHSDRCLSLSLISLNCFNPFLCVSICFVCYCLMLGGSFNFIVKCSNFELRRVFVSKLMSSLISIRLLSSLEGVSAE